MKEEPTTILDVRKYDDYKNEHISNALNIPLEELKDRYDELEKDTVYYVICDSGIKSGRACTLLNKMGFNVINVMGGMSAWYGEIE